ncbi:hypothetical protein NDU88_007427 [Pleurodeles waltl]|uniref:Uncharacterized protein n=1 Tax=Pleurodeles waltl TaxID=8319 RepID=A0AAV7U0F0_PLEWA|nr:hypothetical protein NDU88_007427 [Pleurodeles waltl]
MGRRRGPQSGDQSGGGQRSSNTTLDSFLARAVGVVTKEIDLSERRRSLEMGDWRQASIASEALGVFEDEAVSSGESKVLFLKSPYLQKRGLMVGLDLRGKVRGS